MTNQTTQRWYARPVFFVADVNRAIDFYTGSLGFVNAWHEADGAGDPDGNELLFPTEI